jgi:hypothetical protein
MDHADNLRARPNQAAKLGEIELPLVIEVEVG